MADSGLNARADIRDSTTPEIGNSIDVYVSVLNFNASHLVPYAKYLDASVDEFLGSLKKQGGLLKYSI